MVVMLSRNYLFSRSLADLWGFVGGAAPIHQPDQQRADRYPCQLVPIEKRKPEQPRLQEVIERHPQQTDKRQQQQNPHWANSTGQRLGPISNGTIYDRIDVSSSEFALLHCTLSEVALSRRGRMLYTAAAPRRTPAPRRRGNNN